MKEVLLKGRNISKIFSQGREQLKVLDGINVDIYGGDFTIIMGSSGAGKSTLLYTLSGMDTVTNGTVTYKGTEISRFSEKRMAKLRAEEFGFVFQQTHLVGNLTLFENIAVAGFVGKAGVTKEVLERTEKLLEQMHIDQAKKRLPSQVSGGEAQRAAMARAIIGNPGLIFADEPTGALNKANTEEILNMLSALNEKGQSILMVTHDLRAAIRGNRILYMEDGVILDELPMQPYTEKQAKHREEQIGQWLSALKW